MAAAPSYGEFLEERGRAYVLRVASSFTLTLAAGTKLTCAEAVSRLVKDKRWEIRSAGKAPGASAGMPGPG
jgi:hypothetical protein